MLKVMLATVAVALLAPALAHGATNAVKIRGTVAVKQANRHVLVIASRRGDVESARVSARQLRHAPARDVSEIVARLAAEALAKGEGGGRIGF